MEKAKDILDTLASGNGVEAVICERKVISVKNHELDRVLLEVPQAKK